MSVDRSSEAGEPVLVSDPKQVAHIEAENTLRQFDMAMVELDKWLKPDDYKIKPSKIMQLNRVALQRLSKYAGVFRPGDIKITGSTHLPPDADTVPELMEQLCDYVNENWRLKSPSHLAAYVLWKINWIHPFVDGNGRTARVVSYLVMCAGLGYRLPGTKTIPDQIAVDKAPYYRALEAADKAFSQGQLDLSDLEELINSHLAVQLLDIHNSATGKNHKDRQAIATMPVLPTVGAERAAAKDKFSLIRHIETHPVIYTFLGAVIVAIVTWILGR